MPTERYAHAPEILEHCNRIADRATGCTKRPVPHRGNRPGMGRRPVPVDRADGPRRRVHVAVRRDRDRSAARREAARHTRHREFGGHAFHTSRWDYAYTGGDPEGAPLDGLAGKRVAIIGTGATSVQCVPHLARSCPELFVFQRTPSSVDVRGQPADRPGVVRRHGRARMAGALARELRRQHVGGRASRPRTWSTTGGPTWPSGSAAGSRSARGPASFEDLLADFENADVEKMSEIRARVDEVVRTRRPRSGSRRGTGSSASGRASTTSTSVRSTCRTSISSTPMARGWSAITPAGVVVGGVEYPVDCVIYA